MRTQAVQNLAPRAGTSASEAVRPLDEGLSEQAYDGGLVGAGGRVYPASTPLEAVPTIRGEPAGNDELIVSVNGIRTTLAEQIEDLEALAAATGSRVVGVHNSTGGAGRDLLQSVADKDTRVESFWVDVFDRASVRMGRSPEKAPLVGREAPGHRNPATDSLTNVIWRQVVEKGGSIHLVAHSQGAIITSNALAEVKRRLRTEQRLTPDQATEVLSRCRVETFGGAVHCFVTGPQYDHYVNTRDWVPLLGLKAFGLAGGGANVHRITDPGDGPFWKGPCHDFQTYLRNRDTAELPADPTARR